MVIPPIDIQVRREQYKDLLREAEHERLVQLVLESQPVREPLVQRFSHWAERLMARAVCTLAPANTLSLCRI